jgi:hypothetical protein
VNLGKFDKDRYIDWIMRYGDACTAKGEYMFNGLPEFSMELLRILNNQSEPGK